jgi:hypothetical protein
VWFRARAEGAFDPAIAALLADGAAAILALDGERPAWEEVLAAAPSPGLTLRGPAIEEALAALGDFSAIASPYLVGHAAGVAELAGRRRSAWAFRLRTSWRSDEPRGSTRWDASPSRPIKVPLSTPWLPISALARATCVQNDWAGAPNLPRSEHPTTGNAAGQRAGHPPAGAAWQGPP